MRSAVKSLLAALPVTMRLILKIQNCAQRVQFLAPSHAHSVPPAFSIFMEDGIFNKKLRYQLFGSCFLMIQKILHIFQFLYLNIPSTY